jgi:asparagine synthetase B (glutamine-hydrolysing)
MPIEEWGMQFLEKIDGMFAFAIWDNNSTKIIT